MVMYTEMSSNSSSCSTFLKDLYIYDFLNSIERWLTGTINTQQI